MNITKLIVEILQSGKSVEINGIGTFSSQMVDAHHDKEKGVFYPDRRSAVFTNSFSGDNSVIDVLAQKECVNKEIAEKMWQTYISALKEKLTNQGSHSFSGLGTLVRCADGYAFTADPALDLDGGQSRPIENINMYQSSDKDDPFATYEQSMQFVSEPEPEPEPEPQVIDTPEPQVEKQPQVEKTVESSIEDAKITPAPAVETPMVKETAEKEEQVISNTVAEQQKPVEEPAANEPDTKSEAKEPVAIEQEPIAQPTESVEPTAANEAANDDVRATIDTLDQIPDSGTPTTPAPNKKEGKKKKHTWLWILLAILLLLIGVGCYLFFNHSAWESLKNGIASVRGGGSEIVRPDNDDLDAENADGTINFVDESQSMNEGNTDESGDNAIHPEQEEEQLIAEQNDLEEEIEEEEETEEVSADNEGTSTNESAVEVAPAGQNGKFFVQDYELPFTFSTNLITYDQKDIDRGCRIVRNNLSEYVNRFLASRRYLNAKTPMMERIGKYAQGRFGELYDPNVFYVDRLVPQKDYIHDYLYDFLKQRRESQTCVTIQTELMKYSFLDEILKELVEELGLQPDAPVAKEPAIINAVPKAEVFTAQFAKESKQGYDIIAGFYTNKSTANRMANILKRQGCDAYIIDKQGLYYVSMGSAPTQTAAEALFKHIKGWYDGDIAIRKL